MSQGGQFSSAQQSGVPSTMMNSAPPAATAQQTQGTAPNAYQQAANYLSSAGSRTQTEMGFQPMNVAGRGYTAATAAGATPITAQNVSAGQIATTDLGSYMNPYTQNVINTSLSDLDRQRAMTQQQNSASAAAAGAFGGSRQGLVEAETNRAFADVAARTAAGLQQQGFLNAQQMAGQDIGAKLQAQLANQSAGMTAQQQTAANLLNTQFANQGALNTAGQFGAQQRLQAQLANQNAGLAGSQQRLAAAGQLGNLGTTGFNMANTLQQQQAAQGLLQQQMQQQLLSDAMQQFYGYANSPLNALNVLNSSASGSPLVNNQTRTSQYKPGVLDFLSLGTGLMAL